MVLNSPLPPSAVTQYPRLKCPCFPASMYLLRTIAAAAILAFHSLSFFIFIFTISDVGGALYIPLFEHINAAYLIFLVIWWGYEWKLPIFI